MRFIEAIDDAILGFFTIISHWFQLWTGQTNYFLAKVAIYMMGISTMVHIVNHFHSILLDKDSLGDVLVGILGIPALIFFSFLCNSANNRALEGDLALVPIISPPGGFSERFLPFVRVFLGTVSLIIFPGDIWHVVTAYGILIISLEACYHLTIPSAIVFLYCSKVTPLPPSQGKIKDWFQPLFLKPALVKGDTKP